MKCRFRKNMKRSLCRFLVTWLLISALTACGAKKEPDGEPVGNLNIVRSFASLQEFEEEEKKREDGMTFYYLPAVSPEQYRLTGISKLDGGYFTTRYQRLGGSEIPDTVSEYGKEQLQYISCIQYLYPQPDGVLESYRKNNYREIRQGDRTYYYFEERDIIGGNGALLGYEVVFAVDQTAIYMHLPAVNSIEEALRYAEVEKYSLDRPGN